MRVELEGKEELPSSNGGRTWAALGAPPPPPPPAPQATSARAWCGHRRGLWVASLGRDRRSRAEPPSLAAARGTTLVPKKFWPKKPCSEHLAAKEKTTIGNGGCDVTSQASVMPFLVNNGQPLSLLCCPCSSHIEGACFACALLCGVGRAQTLHSSLQPRRQAGKPKVASRFFNEGEKNKNKKRQKGRLADSELQRVESRGGATTGRARPRNRTMHQCAGHEGGARMRQASAAAR